MDDILCDVRLADDDRILPDLCHDSTCFMDVDVLGWKHSIAGLQRFVDKLLPLLSYYGLVIQPEKCKLLCFRGTRMTPLVLNSIQLRPMEKNEALMIMNLPVGTEATEIRVLEALVDKARGKFFGIQHILCSTAPLPQRLKVLEAVVFGAIRWCLGAIFPTVGAQNLLNYFQFNCVRRMMGIKRGGSELWVDFEARSLRAARAVVHNIQKTRWGDKHLAAYWQYLGHRVREGQSESPSVTGSMSMYRGLGWWELQQQSTRGTRHNRHFPFLMNCERRVARVIGGPNWRVAAANRNQWRGFESAWIEQEQVSWASGRQLALTA